MRNRLKLTSINVGTVGIPVDLVMRLASKALCGLGTTGGAGCMGAYKPTALLDNSGIINWKTKAKIWNVGIVIAAN